MPEAPDLPEPGSDAERRQRVLWERSATRYDRAMAPLERLWLHRLRAGLLAGAAGEVVEVGVGTGLNLAHYPAEVSLLGVDSSPAMLAEATRRAAALGVPVRLVPGDAAVELPDAAADTVVATLLLCSVPDVGRALAEFARVLRPGGRLLLLDHVESAWWPLRGGQAVLDAVTAGTGERWRRRPLPLLPAAGFAVEDVVATRGRVLESVVATRLP
jgi:ubiquinone/menaquinone biosynthesis C-methylase UbiE